MRVLVACDALAGLSPRDASEVIGRAFEAAGASVAVIPLAAAGAPLADALATAAPEDAVVHVDSLAALVAVVPPTPGGVVLDLTALAPGDPAEVAALASPAAVAALAARLDGHTVTAVVPPDEVAVPLTGLMGVLSTRGRERGDDLAVTLSADAAAARWCSALGVDGEAPGSGALGGVGAVVAAAGGTITSGVRLCADRFGLRRVAGRADLVVTGSDVLDFHAVGGHVVRAVAEAGAAVLRPVVAVVGRNFVSARELRLAGVEAAHALLSGAGPETPTPEQLTATAARVAATWRW